MENSLKKLVKDIKSLKIQGASRVEESALAELKREAIAFKGKNPAAFKKQLRSALLLLGTARQTEPRTRNAIIALARVLESNCSLALLKKRFLKKIAQIEAEEKRAFKKISLLGARLVPKGAVVFTHCHSRFVEAILKKAKPKISRVICTETRPLFQGHITARALAKAGIPCTLIVDNAANIFLKEANLLLTGADAIDAHGNVYNKVGTSLISLAAKRHGVPHFVATISSTFDPLTFFGLAEPIEERKPKEVWRERLALVSERNPAFDKTPASQIRAIVSEKGVLRPKLFAKRMVSAMRLKGRNKKDFELHLLLK